MVNLFMLSDTFCNFANWYVSGEGRYKAGRFGLGTGCQRPLQMLFYVAEGLLSLLYSLMLPFAKLTNYALLPKLWYGNGMDMNLGLEQVTNDIWNISQLAK